MDQKQKKPVISIVLIGLNEEKLVGTCMQSLVNQNIDKPYEVIFVDGGSTDGTVDIVKRYTDRLRLRIIIHKGQGIGDSREEGFRATSAPIIASTDSDVILPEDWIKKIYYHIKSHPQCIGIVGPYTLYPSNRALRYLFLMVIRLADLFGKIISGMYLFRGMNFAIRKEVWGKTGGFEKSISALEDVDLAVKASKFGTICYVWSLIILTSPRRFQRKFFKTLWYRLLVYYHRVFLRDYRYGEWEQIRDI
ncbi:glycosyltransferase [Candidatus Gottesmanbacteria bacterium]|nr:glycosyltransferase [Candidatus Gottesmanbacteria bacterium]